MRCERAQKLLSLWLDGMLAEAEERKLLAHLQNCRHCRQIWEEWERARALLRSYPQISLSPEFDRKVLSRLKTSRSPAPPVPAHWLASPFFRLASSAMGGLVVMALTLLTLMLPSQGQSGRHKETPYWQWQGLGREIVQWLDIELGREKRWQNEPPFTSSLSPSRSSRC